jgi:hypothetical protein
VQAGPFSLGSGLTDLATFRGRKAAPSPNGDPGADSPRDDQEATAGGLTRRVRGAQLPANAPVSLRRAQAAPGADSAYPAPSAVAPDATGSPSRASAQTPSADAVYDFLSSFTAGVQRGLDDASRGDATPPAM